jgi:FkbM family methyltransferase
MKPKEIIFLLGLKPKPRAYGYEVRTFTLPTDGEIRFAQWLHPRYPAQQFPQEIIATFRKYVRPGDIAIDIGAHTGDSTLAIALAAGPTGTVFALEPNRYIYPVLERNATLNGTKTHIVPLNFAATPADTEMEFEYSDAGYCNGGNHENVSPWRHAHAFKLKVQCKNLQNYLAVHHPEALSGTRFIKVDAEGYDHTILTTLTDLLGKSRPFIKAEVFKLTTLHQRQALLAFLHDLHYRVHRIQDDTHLEGPLLTEQNLLDQRHYDLFAIPQ